MHTDGDGILKICISLSNFAEELYESLDENQNNEHGNINRHDILFSVSLSWSQLTLYSLI